MGDGGVRGMGVGWLRGIVGSVAAAAWSWRRRRWGRLVIGESVSRRPGVGEALGRRLGRGCPGAVWRGYWLDA
jgi:hypothetical protein